LKPDRPRRKFVVKAVAFVIGREENFLKSDFKKP
jgi:hypothetical protein